MVNTQNLFWLGSLALIGVGIYASSPGQTGDYGAWSLLPAFVTIFVCFISQNILLALLLGIATGGLITHELNLISAFLVPSLGSEKYGQILLVYLWALGGLLGLWNRNGGARYFAQKMADRFVRSRNSALTFAWFMGVVFHQGGTISTVLTGTTVRPISDTHRVSHEELSYVVDSTASPIATIIPFNVWPIYVAGLITLPSMAAIIPNEEAAVALFFKAIPFNFYAWIAVAMTLLFALGRLPFVVGPMKHAMQRVKETGELDAPAAKPIVSAELTTSEVPEGYNPSMSDFLVPILVLLSFCIAPWIAGGSPMVFEGFGMAVMSALCLTILRGMSVTHAFDAMVTGIKGVTLGAIILGFAVTLALVSEKLGTSGYVVSQVADYIAEVPFLLPVILLLICMLTAFSIGSSWGTYAVVLPIALPLAYAISPDSTFLLLNLGAVLGGAVFGDQCSPISDTTVLSALACGADVMDHVSSQLPLACIAAAIGALGYVAIAVFLV